jgi:hypothetical protein
MAMAASLVMTVDPAFADLDASVNVDLDASMNVTRLICLPP